nr:MULTISPECIES: dTDP-4-dehydrorhamnose reductase [unclassified Synechococcus]
MRVLLTGAAGQLGQALMASVPEGIELIATGRSVGQGMLGLDLADAEACRQAVEAHQPDWVLNAGAYTAVDRAEMEPELAQAVNAQAPCAFAEALADMGGHLLQVSTDFVFNGQQGSPYRPEQPRNPLGMYGRTKAAGEEAVEQLLGGSGRGLILRTSWVMGPVGRNFALTMLRLHRERPEIAVVADQVGCPTSTATLAAACWRAIAVAESPNGLPPVLHWSDAGAASWYDVAVAVGELGVELGLLERAAHVNPITTAEYPTPAQRPSYSLLDCSATRQVLDLPALHWRQALHQLLQAIPSP